MKIRRPIIHIDEEKCDGCGVCVPSCAEGAIRIVGGKARLVAERACDGLGACLGECPRGAISLVEAEADAFDETAAHHQKHPEKEAPATEALPCGCPSMHIRTFSPRPHPPVDGGVGGDARPSALTHWPIQIRLVAPTAPFLAGADLLVAADCCAAAAPGFHEDFLAGRVLLLGCPKFDDVPAYVDKFARIFAHNEIRSVTVLVMEVPCCQGLPGIVARGMEAAGKTVPLRKVILAAEGKVLPS